MGSASASVRFVTRDGCRLCDEALRRLRLPARLLGVAIERVDTSVDPDLASRFGDRVPVVVSADGDILAEGPLSPGEAWGVAWRARKR